MAHLIPELLSAALAADPAGPLLTFYDDRPDRGERVELSATTLANWVAKTANLVRDELDVMPGDRVGVLLPPHWQTAVVLHALWALDAEVAPGDGSTDVVCAAEDRLDQVTGPGDVLALSLAPMNGPLAPGSRSGSRAVLDYGAQVLAAGDRFVPSGQSEPTRPALARRSVGAVLDAGRERAAVLGIGAGDRVLVPAAHGDAIDVDAIVDHLLAPLVVGASTVLCRGTGADRDALAARVRRERVTVTLPGR